MGLSRYEISLIAPLSQQLYSRDLDSTPGLTEVEDDTFVLIIRFIIGRDFAVIRSSPESCRDRFAIVSEHTAELKWLILNKHNK